MKLRAMILGGLIALAPAAGALADNYIGCGLGTVLWEGKSGLVPRVLGATTNGTLGNQTFGITSGTLGCKSEGVITADARTQMFASANIDTLAREMAAGEGETLDTLAHLMGVEAADRGAFFALTQSHFADIFASDDVTAGQMLTSINALMAADPTLSRYARI